MSKRFIVPLPGLVTNDGAQQYLTNRGGRWFACRRRSDLRQTWKEEHLGYIPEVYRQFAVDLTDYVPEICWKSAMVLEDFMEEKMEERNKIFLFMFGSNNDYVKGSVTGKFGPVRNLEGMKQELQCEDFIKIESDEAKDLLLATKHIIGVEEL
ncbi:hypothetical protein [Peptoniphilus hominis (ex Hitch et al. 2025)]|uniref:Uncharacterized protein n=1 Tax=Peptoniphilus hominis (ex Hitch et al. 2025) TaxID=3133174 RepID=A0ABV1CBU6_9FIRM